MPSTIGIVASHIVPLKTTVVMGANSANGWIAAFPLNSYGWGTRLANPSTLPTNSIAQLTFTKSASALALNWAASPATQIRAYQWTSSGFGTAYTPVTSTNTGTAPTFNNASTRIIYGTATTGGNYFPSYRTWSDSTGFGATLFTGSVFGGTPTQTVMHPSGNAVAFSHFNSPAITAYPWSDSTGFGTKYTAPSPAMPPDAGYATDFHPSGNAIIIGHFGSPYVSAYAWSSGFGSKYADPSVLPAGSGLGVAYSPNGNDVVVSHSGSPYMTGYSWSSGFGTKYADPATLITGNGTDISFTPTGGEVVVGINGSPAIAAYQWSSGWGTRYADPSVTPTSASFAISPQYS